MVISETGEKLGSMHSKDALRLADERGYDLVCVAPNTAVPVCKLMDYSKYRYDQIKKAREAKKNQKVVTVKEIRLSPTIDTGDLMTKQKAARHRRNPGRYRCGGLCRAWQQGLLHGAALLRRQSAG